MLQVRYFNESSLAENTLTTLVSRLSHQSRQCNFRVISDDSSSVHLKMDVTSDDSGPKIF